MSDKSLSRDPDPLQVTPKKGALGKLKLAASMVSKSKNFVSKLRSCCASDLLQESYDTVAELIAGSSYVTGCELFSEFCLLLFICFLILFSIRAGILKNPHANQAAVALMILFLPISALLEMKTMPPTTRASAEFVEIWLQGCVP